VGPVGVVVADPAPDAGSRRRHENPVSRAEASVLSLHPHIAEVAVAGLPDERLGHKVTAFVKRRGTVAAAALDAHCRGSALADLKRPRDYVFAAEIPKSPVGKIPRRLLVAGAYETEKERDD
jgi:2-furoate---CoA ligase